MSNIRTKMANLSLVKKIFILSFLVINIVILYYSTTNIPISTINLHALASSLFRTTSNQCHLSMQESDNWFCESDLNWKLRKTNHHIQNKRNRISDSRHGFFQNNWEPTIQCEFERRLGNTGDGGKWVCDIHRFQQINNTTKLVYSFGSQGDFSFESAIKTELPNAEIHTFDMGLYKCPDNVCIFHQARLGDGKSDNSKSLQMIINELGHQNREIHILKVDIEGSEFKLFDELFKYQTDIPYIRQILFEIHLIGAGEEPSRYAHHLFELFRSNNYAIFHKEANILATPDIFEYALLRLNPLFFISAL
jgi:hypothetical protein